MKKYNAAVASLIDMLEYDVISTDCEEWIADLYMLYKENPSISTLAKALELSENTVEIAITSAECALDDTEFIPFRLTRVSCAMPPHSGDAA